MEKLIEQLIFLKLMGCDGIKTSFEDEGASFNEISIMRNLTYKVDLELSIKISGCEAKRDMVDCKTLLCDTIVVPMIESNFSLLKFLKSLQEYDINKKKGFNLETIESYHNLDKLKLLFNKFNFVTLGRVDFVSSLEKDRSFVDSDEMLNIAIDIFQIARQNNIKCYLGGAVSINSKQFIETLINRNLLDKFETRYVIFDVKKINMNNFDKLLYHANLFEIEWMKYVRNMYLNIANKDIKRIEMLEERLSNNKII